MRRQWRWILAATAIVTIATYSLGDDVMWTKVSDEFMKESKPYGPGRFRIHGDAVISLKVAKAETKIKPVEEWSDPNVAEYTEEWMYSPGERASRRAANILAGTLGGNITPRFEEPAQRAAWSLSPDWNTIYLATGWTDRTLTAPFGEYTPQLTQLFKSTDQGKHWERLRWPEHQDISFLHFIDGQRGYAIGWGPHIWRTDDAGASWDEIPVPEAAGDPADERQQFDLAALGDDGVLRMTFYDEREQASRVYALPWGEDTPTLAFSVPGQVVMNMVANAQGTVYVLTEQGPPMLQRSPAERQRPRSSVVWCWNGESLQRLHEFPPELTGYALYLTPSEGLLFDGIDESGFLGASVTALSRDGGKTWEIQEEGGGAQGGYYDSRTGTRWRVEGYSLYKRMIP